VFGGLYTHTHTHTSPETTTRRFFPRLRLYYYRIRTNSRASSKIDQRRSDFLRVCGGASAGVRKFTFKVRIDSVRSLRCTRLAAKMNGNEKRLKRTRKNVVSCDVQMQTRRNTRDS